MKFIAGFRWAWPDVLDEYELTKDQRWVTRAKNACQRAVDATVVGQKDMPALA